MKFVENPASWTGEGGSTGGKKTRCIYAGAASPKINRIVTAAMQKAVFEQRRGYPYRRTSSHSFGRNSTLYISPNSLDFGT